VPINEVLRGLLLQKLQNRVGEYIFSLGGSPIKPDFFTHKFKEAVRAAKLPEKLHVHSLRHTFATWLVQGGISIYEIQRLLGHSSITVTEVYAHLAPAQLHMAVEKIALGVEVNMDPVDNRKQTGLPTTLPDHPVMTAKQRLRGG
jgi:site-specific recombinase XerD